VTPKTVASWMKRLDEKGADALVQLPGPVNKFPDFVRYAVQRLQTLCPTLGKKKPAEVLARAGLHLATTTIGRIRQEKPTGPPVPSEHQSRTRVVTAKRPNHVWHIDLTTVPTQTGFWCAWLPLAFPQSWPFCWWIAVVLDHYSRRVMAFAIFRSAPKSVDVRTFLGRAVHAAGTFPKYLISDKGPQFWPTRAYRHWCSPERNQERGSVFVWMHDERPAAIGQFCQSEKLVYMRMGACRRRPLSRKSRSSPTS